MNDRVHHKLLRSHLRGRRFQFWRLFVSPAPALYGKQLFPPQNRISKFLIQPVPYNLSEQENLLGESVCNCHTRANRSAHATSLLACLQKLPSRLPIHPAAAALVSYVVQPTHLAPSLRMFTCALALAAVALPRAVIAYSLPSARAELIVSIEGATPFRTMRNGCNFYDQSWVLDCSSKNIDAVSPRASRQIETRLFSLSCIHSCDLK